MVLDYFNVALLNVALFWWCTSCCCTIWCPTFWCCSMQCFAISCYSLKWINLWTVKLSHSSTRPISFNMWFTWPFKSVVSANLNDRLELPSRITSKWNWLRTGVVWLLLHCFMHHYSMLFFKMNLSIDCKTKLLQHVANFIKYVIW